jgi:hypothetical protein
MKSCHALVVFFVLTAVTTLGAKEYVHQESGLTFSLPKGWTCTKEGGKITIENGDKSLACVGGVIPQETGKAIFADIKKFVDDLEGLEDAEVTGGPEKETVNGLVQTWYEGTATCLNNAGAETEIEWDMTIVSGGKAVVFFVGMGKLDENEEAYEEFFESIKKVDAGKE